MHYAVSHGNFDVVSILLDSKFCNVNQPNNAGYTCVMLVSLAQLHQAAHQTVVRRLLQLSDVNVRAQRHGQTSLMLAVSHGNVDMARMLLAAGADINIQDEDGSTALMCAAEHGRGDIVKLLLAQPDCDSTVQDMVSGGLRREGGGGGREALEGSSMVGGNLCFFALAFYRFAFVFF